mgnify:CR=1 FL=1
MEIKYYNREKKTTEIEKVYGDSGIKWLYRSFLGKCLSKVLIKPMPSRIYGKYQNSPLSQRKIGTFIENFDIDLSEFIPETGCSQDAPYSNFNSFFIRKFKTGKREFVGNKNILGAPCEARYFAYHSIDEDQEIPVKGKYLNARSILKDDRWEQVFKDGPVLLARLCPVDYHRFHFPDNGKLIDYYNISGKLHSVNPLALKTKGDIFATNEREISILQTENFGKIGYVEVGAMMVGKIVQSFEKDTFQKGEEKGYFLFGGSTVIVFGEKGKWIPDADILENTSKGIETFIKLGRSTGTKR